MSARSLTRPALQQLVGQRLAQALDVHGAAAGEVREQAEDLGRAGAVGAVASSPRPRGRTTGVAADRALGRHLEDLLLARALAQHRPDDLRDDLAGALDDHGVADADVLAPDVVLVVQRRQLHRGVRDDDRLEHGEGVQAARAADVDLDVAAASSSPGSAGT